MSSVERDFLDRALIDNGADRRRSCLDYGYIGRHKHLFGERANVHLKILDDCLGNFDSHLIRDASLEAISLDLDCVVADGLSVCVVRSEEVPRFLAVTFAFGNTAPLASVTVP